MDLVDVFFIKELVTEVLLKKSKNFAVYVVCMLFLALGILDV